MNGPEICHDIRAYLRGCGWTVIVFNHNRPMPAGAKGLPDILAFGRNKTLLVEVKGDGDRLRPEQDKFAHDMDDHTGPNLFYMVAHSADDVVAFLEEGKLFAY